jgi:hypothetical protein
MHVSRRPRILFSATVLGSSILIELIFIGALTSSSH